MSTSKKVEGEKSRWPRRLLIFGAASLVLGTVWMFSVMPDMSEQMHPETNNLVALEPGEAATVEIQAAHIYAAYQKVNTTSELDGEVMLFGPDGGNITAQEPSLWVGVGRTEFKDGSVFIPLSWWQVEAGGNHTFESNSTLTTWVIDQNAASNAAIRDPGFIGACFSIILGVCLLPLALLIQWANRSTTTASQSLLLQTADGRQVPLAVDPSSSGVTPGQAVLTTDQVYQLARIREQLGPEATMEIQINPVQTGPEQPAVAAPFADRPDHSIPQKYDFEVPASQTGGLESRGERVPAADADAAQAAIADASQAAADSAQAAEGDGAQAAADAAPASTEESLSEPERDGPEDSESDAEEDDSESAGWQKWDEG